MSAWDTTTGAHRTNYTGGRSFVSAISERFETPRETCVGNAKNDLGEARMDSEFPICSLTFEIMLQQHGVCAETILVNFGIFTPPLPTELNQIPNFPTQKSALSPQKKSCDMDGTVPDNSILLSKIVDSCPRKKSCQITILPLFVIGERSAADWPTHPGIIPIWKTPYCSTATRTHTLYLSRHRSSKLVLTCTLYGQHAVSGAWTEACVRFLHLPCSAVGKLVHSTTQQQEGSARRACEEERIQYIIAVLLSV